MSGLSKPRTHLELIMNTKHLSKGRNANNQSILSSKSNSNLRRRAAASGTQLKNQQLMTVSDTLATYKS